MTTHHDRIESQVESSANANEVADLGDLTQLARGQERRLDTTDRTVESVYSLLSGISERIASLPNTPEFRTLMATIDDMAKPGEPMYELLKNKHIA